MDKKIVNKLLITIFFIFGFLTIFSLSSTRLDADLGWQLRFGKEALEQNFQYLDSYTWSFEGKPWINHEWGGNILFWILYNSFGYVSLSLLVSLIIWTTFALSPKLINKSITTFSLLLSLGILLSLNFLIIPRLTMFGPMFVLLLLLILEKVPYKKNLLYLLPLLFWVWSILHGSWVLGFIIISIYMCGNLIVLFFKRLPFKKTKWNLHLIYDLGIWSFISTIAILLNPYTWHIWKEILYYFTEHAYKEYIIEWTSSFTYPIYLFPLFIMAICIPLIFLAIQKRITFENKNTLLLPKHWQMMQRGLLREL